MQINDPNLDPFIAKRPTSTLRPTVSALELGYPTIAQQVCRVLGIGFVAVGMLGFFMPGFLGAHLSATHNLIHLVTGAVAIGFGYYGSVKGARQFSWVFGAVYFLLGIYGFLAGQPMVADNNLIELIPNYLYMGTVDHYIHVITGGVFLIAASLSTPRAVARMEDSRNDRRAA